MAVFRKRMLLPGHLAAFGLNSTSESGDEYGGGRGGGVSGFPGSREEAVVSVRMEGTDTLVFVVGAADDAQRVGSGGEVGDEEEREEETRS
jgi:hypothetical protein